MNNQQEQLIKDGISRWLTEVVIGLGLCPFAAKPWREGGVLIEPFMSSGWMEVTEFIESQLQRLDETPTIETILIAAPNAFADFYEYNQYLDEVDRLLTRRDWQGVYQVASFHPRYQFADTAAHDESNLTNCSPYPIFHLLREQSLTDVLQSVANPEAIPARNIQVMQSLSQEQIESLFPYWRGKK